MNNLTNQFTGRDVSRQGNFKSVLHSTCRKCISNMLLQVPSLELKTEAPACTPSPLVAVRRKLMVKTVTCLFFNHNSGYRSSCTGSDHRSIYHRMLSPAATMRRNSRKFLNGATILPKTGMLQYKTICNFAVATNMTRMCSNIQVRRIPWVIR